MLTSEYTANGCRTLERAQDELKHLVRFFNPARRALDITTDRVTAYIALRLVRLGQEVGSQLTSVTV